VRRSRCPAMLIHTNNFAANNMCCSKRPRHRFCSARQKIQSQGWPTTTLESIQHLEAKYDKIIIYKTLLILGQTDQKVDFEVGQGDSFCIWVEIKAGNPRSLCFYLTNSSCYFILADRTISQTKNGILQNCQSVLCQQTKRTDRKNGHE